MISPERREDSRPLTARRVSGDPGRAPSGGSRRRDQHRVEDHEPEPAHDEHSRGCPVNGASLGPPARGEVHSAASPRRRWPQRPAAPQDRPACAARGPTRSSAPRRAVAGNHSGALRFHPCDACGSGIANRRTYTGAGTDLPAMKARWTSAHRATVAISALIPERRGVLVLGGAIRLEMELCPSADVRLQLVER